LRYYDELGLLRPRHVDETTGYRYYTPDQIPILNEIFLLKEMGLRRVLVTGSGQNSLLSRIDTDFPGIFDPGMRVTARDVKHGKPHPEPFIRAMQLARVSPSQSIVVENAPLGVEAGNKAGAFTVGVVTGPIPVEEMERAGAAVVFPSMEAFAEALPTLIFSLLSTSIDPL